MSLSTTDANSMGLIWAVPHLASLTSSGDGQELGWARSTSVPGFSGPHEMAETNARRQMYPKEYWLALKLVIQRLYIEEKLTFTKVAEYLDQHHGFKPTKRQFLRRVKEWGFEKNVKRHERRAILKSLGDSVKDGDFEEKTLRGRRLDKVKIERWKKREGLGTQARLGRSSVTFNRTSIGGRSPSLPAASISIEPCNDEDAVEELHCDKLHPGSIALDQRQTFNPWLAVDTINSPHLTGLIGALTLVELYDDIPDLDLSPPYSKGAEKELDLNDSNKGGCIITSYENFTLQPSVNITPHSGFFASNDPTIQLIAKHYARMLGSLNKLRPFPRPGQSVKILMYPRTDHLVLESSLKIKELECNIKLKTLSTMEHPGIIILVKNIRSIAHRHFELEHFRLAETWWRRFISCYLAIPGYQLGHVLYACLWLISSIKGQGMLSKARSLHRSIHSKILNLLEPEHEIVIFSKTILAAFHNSLLEFNSELRIYREIVQIGLLHFGPRDTVTLKYLSMLGWALDKCGQSRDAEEIFRIRLGLDCGLSSHADRYTVRESVSVMSELASCLIRQQKYVDSATLLDMLDVTRRQFRDLIGGDPTCMRYHLEKARYLRAKGMLAESEEIFRNMLRHAPDHANFSITTGWLHCNCGQTISLFIQFKG